MAAKRLINHEEDDHHDDELQQKRMRPIPSFATVVEMAIYRNSLNEVVEPWIRRVVNEEVKRTLERRIKTLNRSPSLRIQAPEPANLKLVFTNKSLPTLFTFNKIHDINNQSLQFVLVEQRGDQLSPFIPHYPIKVEIVVVDGDFPSTDRGAWTVDEFNRSIVKERENKRPLLAKDLNYTMRDSNSVTLGTIEFTDNSSWVRCRKFKLGAKVVVAESSHGDRILEALTDAFVVKDHRGELYKKHYPPKLGDEVWRLEKIGKDGIFHKRLTQEGVHNVQDFLKMALLNPTKLKKIFGGKNGTPTDRMWDSILKHAKTCNLGNKLYISDGPNFSIILDPICQIFSININGQNYPYPTSDMNLSLKKFVDELVENAYRNWDSLQEIERPVNDTFQPPQGNLMGEYGNDIMIPYQQIDSNNWNY